MVCERSSSKQRQRRWKVCVIGAGPAGLVAARELKREGHHVVVFEQNADVGGTWLYDPRVEEEDPLGLNPRRKVHSSVYASLRLNSSRETMGLSDYPFVVKEGRDGRRFPGHGELLLYLKDFAKDFNLLQLINFNTYVEYVGILSKDTQGKRMHVNGVLSKYDEMDKPVKGTDCQNIEWVVRSRRKAVKGLESESEEKEAVEQIFDGVVVCNGHYTQPRITQIPEDPWFICYNVNRSRVVPILSVSARIENWCSSSIEVSVPHFSVVCDGTVSMEVMGEWEAPGSNPFNVAPYSDYTV
eukprot:Gb_31851 [translate_table: standard]